MFGKSVALPGLLGRVQFEKFEKFAMDVRPGLDQIDRPYPCPMAANTHIEAYRHAVDRRIQQNSLGGLIGACTAAHVTEIRLNLIEMS